MNEMQAKILNKIVNKYNLNPCKALDELLQLEEQIHIYHMEHGTDATFTKTYYYSALGVMNNRYKNG